MARELTEHFDRVQYNGRIEEDRRWMYAQLGVSRDCEAELAVLLKGAAKSGVIRLDRVLNFLTEPST